MDTLRMNKLSMTEQNQTPRLNFDIWCIIFQELADADRLEENARLWAQWEEEYIQSEQKRIAEDDVFQGHQESLSRIRRNFDRWGYVNYVQTSQLNWISREFTRWICAIRTLSSGLNAAIVPIIYASVNFSKMFSINRLQTTSPTHYKKVQGYIQRYCKTLILLDKFEDASLDFILQCQQIKYLTWSLQDLNIDKANRISTILTERFLRVNASANFEVFRRDGYFCRLDLPFEDRHELHSKGQLSITVRTFWEGDGYTQAFSHFVPFENMFPPIRALRMCMPCGYDWVHSAEDVAQLWDFTQLTTLYLEVTDGRIPMLETVPVNQLAQLRVFSLFLFDRSEGIEYRLSKLLPPLFKTMKSLESLTFFGTDMKIILPMETISLAGEAIKKLSLDCHLRMDMDPITHEDLEIIRGKWPNLEELKFNLPRFQYDNIGGVEDRLCFEAKDSLDCLINFTNLKWLHLLAERDLGTPFYDRDDVESTDPDYDDAEQTMRTLHAKKLGVPFEKITITLDGCETPPNWKKIPGAMIGEKGAEWSYRRIWSSRTNLDGEYEQWTEKGYERVGNAEDPMPEYHDN